ARMACAPAISARESPTSAFPASVNCGVLPERSNNTSPSVVSSVWIDWLIDDCSRPSFRAAAEKLPASATATRMRIWSSVSESIIHHLQRWILPQFCQLQRLEQKPTCAAQQVEGIPA